MADMSEGQEESEFELTWTTDDGWPAVWVCVCIGVVVINMIRFVIMCIAANKERNFVSLDGGWVTQTDTDKARYEEACPRLRFCGDG